MEDETKYYTYNDGLAQTYAPKLRSDLSGYNGLPSQYTPSEQPKQSPSAGQPKQYVSSGDASTEPQGMGRTMANSLAGAQIGLGLLGYLENRKTGKLQRDALRNDIATAKEHRANRAALGASWGNAWKGNGG